MEDKAVIQKAKINKSILEAMNAAYLAGFNASCEGWNGEYPYFDKKLYPEDDDEWVTARDALINIISLNLDIPTSYTPDDVAALVAATRRHVHNIEHWLDSGQAAGPEESKSIYQQMKDALEPFGGTE